MKRFAFFMFIVLALSSSQAQQPAKPAGHEAEKPPEIPAQIELLKTHVRFEADGDSRKEVHAHVRINNELGARQFARLNFDYNRSFQQIEIPIVRITHASGGTADILPSAISDQPNPGVTDAPAYQDVRVKSVRILGLAPGDKLEYQVITTTKKHPMAPDFWFDHAFDRTGVVSHEIFEMELPPDRKVQMHINPATPPSAGEKPSADEKEITHYRWDRRVRLGDATSTPLQTSEADVVLTTFESWRALAERLAVLLQVRPAATPPIKAKFQELTSGITSSDEQLKAVYDFVSQKIATIDLPLGSTGFTTRSASDILSSGAATSEDKYILFSALVAEKFGAIRAALIPSPSIQEDSGLPLPAFGRLLAVVDNGAKIPFLDLALQVAPFGLVSGDLRGKQALIIGEGSANIWRPLTRELPFAAFQHVIVEATLSSSGSLSAKVKYTMRGDNELLLRVAFHKAPRDKWNDVAQLLALSDGFRGKVTKVTASDPYATKDPLTVEYEIAQPKFVDWSKKPVRIPALLPLLGLPEPSTTRAPGGASPVIELGTPLEVQAHITLHLPPGTTARVPTGASVDRDYAKFASQYSAEAQSVSASRHLSFLLREISADRRADYNAFVRAIQNDEAQEFTLEKSNDATKLP